MINKGNEPQLVAVDPQSMPVWEIIGAEFTTSEGPPPPLRPPSSPSGAGDKQSAGISIRFPRIMRQRHDKTWKEATDLARLQKLAEASKEHAPERHFFFVHLGG